MSICTGCLYYSQCGSSTRTSPCAGKRNRPKKATRFGYISALRWYYGYSEEYAESLYNNYYNEGRLREVQPILLAYMDAGSPLHGRRLDT